MHIVGSVHMQRARAYMGCTKKWTHPEAFSEESDAVVIRVSPPAMRNTRAIARFSCSWYGLTPKHTHGDVFHGVLLRP